jgi:ribosome-binding protein aMBF1 (putative translation factor)
VEVNYKKTTSLMGLEDPKKELKLRMKIKNTMTPKNKSITKSDEVKEPKIEKTEKSKRNKLEAGYENFNIGAMIHKARLQKGMTQEQLAEKTGTTKSHISKIENNLKEARFSTLKKIVELGLGGDLELSIKF